eukprot:TRINITY_DN2183_c0_g1_i1.p1 TRINITY_DN2183_c0_g1~~TRINITY_DN2183_c0_g1_i1.p1  ORF type:complete len:747 (+),score=224.57 TRINITY_DN2183_c0_g1_i1:24-2243(+)
MSSAFRSVVTFDPTVKGLDKVVALSVLQSLAPSHSDAKEGVSFVEEVGDDAPLAQSSVGVTVAEGLVPVFLHAAQRLELDGNGPSEAKAIETFVGVGLTQLNDKNTITSHVASFNEHLAMRSFFVGYRLSAADIAIWVGLINNPRWNALQKESAKYPHVIRWFKYLETDPRIVQLLTAKKASKDTPNASGIGGVGDAGSFDIGIDKNTSFVCTRFPPEPSGYMHIGHAKAALLNDIIAKMYKGKCILRFDDTNPSKEKDEFVQSIIEDLETLGIDYAKPITHTSDYFDLMLDYCTKMIKEGKAYVDDTDVDTMRAERLSRTNSKNRDNSLDENLRRWEEMKIASPEGLKNSVRAKIDMQSRNGTLRDPVIYRCNLQPHHKTGTKYKVYPTYDFACPIVDSLEGVTHALRTSEYNDRNAQYYWIVDALGIRKPRIEDYSRLNMVYTLMSKRKLTWFVDSGRVTGWDDPRFPTVRGMVRRGLEVEALRAFVIEQGFSKNTNLMGWDKLWNTNKRIIDPVAHRFSVVSQDKVQFILEDKNDWEEVAEIDLHPKNPEVGKKPLLRAGRIYIESVDAQEIADGEEVTLMGWGNAIASKVQKTTEGKVFKIIGHTKLDGSVKTTKKKLTWVAVPSGYSMSEEKASGDHDHNPIVVKLIELDYLITVPSMEEDMVFEDVLRPSEDTWKESLVLGEAAMKNIVKGQTIQINRRGFYKCDKAATADAPMELLYIPDGRSKAASKLVGE